jgi:septal ring factor EnvC (AmiA/AmiB activator)
MKDPTIKAEPIDDPPLMFSSKPLHRASSINKFQSPAKRVKIEPEPVGFTANSSSLPAGSSSQSVASDEHLKKWKQEYKESEKDLAAAERVAAIRQERKEQRARIPAMEEALRSNTDDQSSRS